MKRFLSVLLVCVMLVGILPVFAAAATVEETTAANDSKETAQLTNFVDTMVGVLDGMMGEDIIDFYKFEMKESGRVNILALSENKDFGFRLDGESGYITGSEGYGMVQGYHCELLAEYYLEAGTYYLSFTGTSINAFTYFFQVLETDGEAPEAPDGTEATTPAGEDEETVNPFTDVTSTDYFFEPVLWAFDEGVTAGTSATTFDPNATCTRAQVVTFLWRAAGSPEPASSDCPFTDVEAGSWYSKAVLWAAENGITAGTSATTFAPSATILREQFVTFLWRAITGGKPILTVDCPFGDISEDGYYYDAVLWATQNGYCTGTGGDRFEPQGSCTRGQTVTFLHRYYADKPVTAPSAITLSTRSLFCTDMAYGKSGYSLKAAVLPVDASGSAITWTSSNPAVATVSDSGNVSIVGSGEAVITAQCGNAVAYCRITPPDLDVSWFVERAHHYVNNNLVVDSQLNPRAGTYLNSEGELCVITMVFAKVLTNGGWWDSRFITTVYNQTTGEEIRQPAEYYQKKADRAYGASKIKYLDLANEYLTVETKYEQFTEYYQKGLEYGLEGYWVPVGQ